MMSPQIAAKVYAAVQNQTTGRASAQQADEGPGFSELVQNAVADAIKSSKVAETQMTAHSEGKADLVDVVTAISSAQSNLETVMAVRDQVISAYQQIMQMSI